MPSQEFHCMFNDPGNYFHGSCYQALWSSSRIFDKALPQCHLDFHRQLCDFFSLSVDIFWRRRLFSCWSKKWLQTFKASVSKFGTAASAGSAFGGKLWGLQHEFSRWFNTCKKFLLANVANAYTWCMILCNFCKASLICQNYLWSSSWSLATPLERLPSRVLVPVVPTNHLIQNSQGHSVRNIENKSRRGPSGVHVAAWPTKHKGPPRKCWAKTQNSQGVLIRTSTGQYHGWVNSTQICRRKKMTLGWSTSHYPPLSNQQYDSIIFAYYLHPSLVIQVST